MINIEELKGWANDLKPVFFDINVSLNNLRILQHERSNKLRVNYFDTYLNLMYQQYFILIIQLTKIYSTKNNTHKRNINKLFSKFQNEGLHNEVLNFHNNVESFKNRDEILAAIKEFKEKIDANAVSILTIVSLRDKVFAHTDPEDVDKAIDIEGYSTLVDLSNKIYNTLFGKILGDQFNPNIGNKYDLRILFNLSEVH